MNLAACLNAGSGNVSEDLEERIKALVAEHTGERLGRITLETRIRDDLPCDGDDAVDLFEAFAKEFEVDLSGIQWTKHFHSETDLGCMPLGCITPLGWLFVFLAWIVRGKKAYYYVFPAADPLVPVTVRDLVEAAKAKQWVKTYPTESTDTRPPTQ